MTDPFPDSVLELRAREQYRRGDADFPLVAKETALVLIDMQEEFVTTRGGPYRVPEAARRLPQMARLLETFRRSGLPVIHTAFAATHRFLDRPRLGGRMPNRAPAGFDDSGLFTSLPEMHEAELCILRRSFARVLAVEAILEELELG